MKLQKRLSAACGVLSLLAFIACSDSGSQHADKQAKPEKPVTFQSIKAVPLSEATTAIRAYGDWWRSLNLPDSETAKLTRAFLIPGSDLIGVLDPPSSETDIVEKCNFKQARAYIGLDANNTLHLYLTPVNEQGADVILNIPGSTDQQVFDLTTPCPRTCDEASALYTAFNP